ncbi:MAG: urea transporter [Janthinobacterium lividum]
MREHFTFSVKAIVNSYAILFFSQNKVLGVILLFVSFFNVAAGFSGLLCASFAIGFTTLTGYQRQEIEKGIFSFNTLLLGIGFGTFYHINNAFFIWLAVACLVCILITINCNSWLTNAGLPFLSLPFIISFWILLSASGSIFSIGLEPKSSSILNELTASDNGQFLSTIRFPYYADLFFRAISAVIFQDNVLAGFLISLGLLIHSRIAFCAALLGFITACLFNVFSGNFQEEISYYHLGSNFMMAAIGISSFFLIPSYKSYLWAVISIPITFLLVNALTRFIGLHDLPILSLPFCLVTLLLLQVFKQQKTSGKTVLTPFQNYSPEKNLYQYLNSCERLSDFKYLNIKPPFMGSWLVSQGYDGNITHKGEWAQALDFVIQDEQKTYRFPGTKAEHFYCYNKPVLACADGVVEELTDQVEDNEIGSINTAENWGNSIVIRHASGLYSKVSHLKKKSAKVKVGDFVKQGDLIGLCGNSGYSPEPHLHFQMQTTPYIGSKTLAYPFSYFNMEENQQQSFRTYEIPKEGMTISSIPINTSIKEAFSFRTGSIIKLETSTGKTVIFEVQTDASNQTYFYCKSTNSYAYFINNGTAFYFTGFYGDQESLLYLFYLAAYKIIFTDQIGNKGTDIYPLQLVDRNPISWIQDILAPFYRFIRLNYQSNNQIENENIKIDTQQFETIFRKKKQTMNATITLKRNRIQSFQISFNKRQTEAKWIAENMY